MIENYKILVADDNPENAEQIIDYLQEMGKSYFFIQALNGKIAYSLTEKKMPDLIITDWEMPIMDGIEFIKLLKSNEKTKDIPVIMCTGVMTTPENLKTALDAGAVDYIRKPVEKLELTARVNSMLKLSDFIKRVKEQNETLFEQKNEIENQNVKLTEHVATKDKFFSIIAHDLINHFNGIIGMSELLVNYGDDIEDFPKMIEAINHEAVDAFKLLENLLQWARSQTNRISFNPIQLNLNNLVEKIFKLLDNMAASKKITLTSTIADNFTVLGDNDMLHTILRNLVSNAIKFTNKNGMVSIRAEKQQHQNIISISDSGVGMSEKILKKLFKINEKISSKGTENEAGTGLGLLLCKEFVEKHHGKILVESQIGNGSTFSIYLPVNE